MHECHKNWDVRLNHYECRSRKHCELKLLAYRVLRQRLKVNGFLKSNIYETVILYFTVYLNLQQMRAVYASIITANNVQKF